ncbi:MAG TPA: alpha/beta hydrolase-fold protein [Segetibacter sp.]
MENYITFQAYLKKRIGDFIVEEKKYASITVDERILYSEYLERDVLVDFYKPVIIDGWKEVSLLLVNDGQDLRKMDFGSIIDPIILSGSIHPLMYVGIHCGADRLNEYGTVYMTDYKGRGGRSGRYNKFIFDELLPFIKKEFAINTFTEKSFAGFSLGALNAIDNVWNHAAEFSKVGVFSGALWWRRNGYEDADYNPEKDRIMHLQVMNGVIKPHLKFFFECGQLDEISDRNNNGVIDSIDDALDLIAHLKALGYTDSSIQYFELEDGGHNVETWARAFPDFLKWGWGK